MPFRKKGSPFWHYDFQIGGCRFSGSTKKTTFREAKAVEDAAKVAARSGAPTPASYTVSQALGTYYSDVSQHQSSAATTRSQAKVILSHIDPATRLSDLTQADLVTLYARMRSTAANSTCNRRMQTLSRAIKYMVKNHGAGIGDMDFKSIEAPEPAEVIRELSLSEQERLFERLRPDLLPFVKFALMTGARRETIECLKWPDVDFDNMTIRFWVKGDRPQPFPMSNQLRAFLSSLPRSTVLSERGFVFTLVYQGWRDRKKQGNRQRVHRSTFDAEWRKALVAAEIEGFRVHDLRHTFATRMLRETQNLKLVSRLLGHKSLETTMRYAHVLDDDLRRALDNFDLLDVAESRKKSRNSDKM